MAVMQDAYSHCEKLVREADKDRFLATLFAPAERRPYLFALYAFNIEISRVREAARQALPGEMRLQWWRDVLSERGYGDVKSSPVATALLDTLACFHLSSAPLIELLEGRKFDLYDDPMSTRVDLETYATQTAASLIECAVNILLGRPSDEAAVPVRHAGIAYAIAGLLRAFPIHAARGQIYVPIEILDRHGVARESIFAGQTTPELHSALADMRAMAHDHIAALRKSIGDIPQAAAPAFIPVALVAPLLARMERRRYNPFRPIELPQWRRQWAFWRATWGGILAV